MVCVNPGATVEHHVFTAFFLSLLCHFLWLLTLCMLMDKEWSLAQTIVNKKMMRWREGEGETKYK